jgi:hypothetical protein
MRPSSVGVWSAGRGAFRSSPISAGVSRHYCSLAPVLGAGGADGAPDPRAAKASTGGVIGDRTRTKCKVPVSGTRCPRRSFSRIFSPAAFDA